MHSSSDIFSGSQTESWNTRHALDSALANLLVGDFQSRWEISKQLAAFGEEVIAPLLALLTDTDLEWEVRWFAARILGHFDHPEVISALLALLLEAEDEDLRQGAADALTGIGPGAVQALTQLVSQPEHEALAVWALAQIRHPSTVAPLLRLAQDATAAVRALAIEALAGYRDAQVLAAVQAALIDTAGVVRLKAVEAMSGYRYQLDAQALIGLLQPRLQDEDPQVARAAIAVLGRLTADEAAAALSSLLQASTTPASHRLAAIQALGWMATASAQAGLAGCWDEAPIAERIAIVGALSRQTTPGLKAVAADLLLYWLQDLADTPSGTLAAEEQSQLRQQAALALAQLEARNAVPLLHTWQTDPDEGVRLHAIAALRRLRAGSDQVP